jgi:hypothetical protein
MDTLPIHPFLRHPHTGEPLRAIAVVNGRPVWPVMGASPDDNNNINNGTGNGTGNGGNAGNGTGSQGTGANDGGNAGGHATGAGGGTGTGARSDTDRGFPEGTPLEQMTVEQREAYWRFYARKHEAAARQAPTAQELADLRDKATKYDQAQRDQMTDLERERADNAQLREENAKYKLAEQRRDAAKAAGLTSDDAEFITGATPEEMKASAERLKTRLGTSASTTHATTHDQGVRSGGNGSGGTPGVAAGRDRYREKHKQTTTT